MADSKMKLLLPRITRPIPPIGWILILAVVLRLALPLAVVLTVGGQKGLENFHQADSASYLGVAKNLLLTGEFALEDHPHIRRTPGYPVVLLVGIWLGCVEWVVITIQAGLCALTVYGVYRIVQVWTMQSGGLFTDYVKHAAPLLAAAVLALDPVSVKYSAQLMTETQFTCLLVWHLYWLIRYLNERRLLGLAAAGALIGAATLTRPVSLFLPLAELLCLAALWFSRIRKDTRLMLQLGLYFVIAMAPSWAWQVRNTVVADYGGLSSIQDINLYFYQGAATKASVENRSYYEVQRELRAREPDTYISGPRSRQLRKEGMQMILGHPWTYAEIHLRGMIMTLVDPGATEYLKMFDLQPAKMGLLGRITDQGIVDTVRFLLEDRPLMFWANLLFAGVLAFQLGLAAIGVLSGTLKHPIPDLVVLGVALYLLIVSGGPMSYSRFRHPMMPIVSVFAGLGVCFSREALVRMSLLGGRSEKLGSTAAGAQ